MNFFNFKISPNSTATAIEQRPLLIASRQATFFVATDLKTAKNPQNGDKSPRLA